MKILAIDSSGLTASVAVVTEDTLIAEYTVHYKKTHSQTLLPMIDEIVKMIEFDLHEIDAIAVAAGPGSFTGLRIGSSTAKGLGMALGKPLIAVPTVDGLAYNFYGCRELICPMMDARRSQVYTGLYNVKEDLTAIIPQEAVAVDDIIDKINRIGQEVIFLGDGVPVYQTLIEGKVKVPYTFAPAHLSRQRAGALGALAVQYYKKGIMQSADDHQPIYLRLSQAERELMEKNGSHS